MKKIKQLLTAEELIDSILIDYLVWGIDAKAISKKYRVKVRTVKAVLTKHLNVYQ